MATDDHPAPIDDGKVIRILDQLTVADMRMMLWFFSGLSPEGFLAALALIKTPAVIP